MHTAAIRRVWGLGMVGVVALWTWVSAEQPWLLYSERPPEGGSAWRVASDETAPPRLDASHTPPVLTVSSTQETTASLVTYRTPPSAQHLMKGKRINYGIWIDPAKWRTLKPLYATTDLAFESPDRMLSAITEVENFTSDFDALKASFLKRYTATEGKKFRVVSEEKRVVNGRQVLHVHFERDVNPETFTYLSYVATDGIHTIHVITWVSTPFFAQRRQDMLDFLHGFEISAATERSPAELVEVGREIFDGKGTCNLCHPIGEKEPGIRGPNLAGIGRRAHTRIKEARYRGTATNAVEYLVESLYQPSTYVVDGYQSTMVPLGQEWLGETLTPMEVAAVVAFLQSLGGEATVNRQTRFPTYEAGVTKAKPEGIALATTPCPYQGKRVTAKELDAFVNASMYMRMVGPYLSVDKLAKGLKNLFAVSTDVISPNPEERGGVNLCGADLSGANLAGKQLHGFILRRANLAHANLSGADLSHTNLEDARLNGANLTGATLSDMDLRRTDMREAILSQADLASARLWQADLRGAVLQDTRFVFTELMAVNLHGVKQLTQAQLDVACVDTRTQLPPHLERPAPCHAHK